jgi:hypothetical protein
MAIIFNPISLYHLFGSQRIGIDKVSCKLFFLSVCEIVEYMEGIDISSVAEVGFSSQENPTFQFEL